VDFDLSDAQSARLDVLRRTLAMHSADHIHTALPGEYDSALVAALRSTPELTGPDMALLDRVLLVEEAARFGARCNPTAVLLVEPLAGIHPGGGPIAVMADTGSAQVRDGADARIVVVLARDRARWAPLQASAHSAVESGVGHGYGLVAPSGLIDAEWALVGSPAAHYHLGLAAEIAGAARAALDHTAEYLTQRRAFGTTLSTFQALRHRLSELAVDVAGTSALVRQAAWHNDATMIAGAVAAAATLASVAPPELHQICGARGFTAEFGLSRFTMWVQALRIELGGAYNTAVDYADERWGEHDVRQ
jgi:hypothetical protein